MTQKVCETCGTPPALAYSDKPLHYVSKRKFCRPCRAAGAGRICRDPQREADRRRKIGNSFRGKPIARKTRIKIGNANRGRIGSRGKDHPQWTGIDVGYAGAHGRAGIALNAAGRVDCDFCGAPPNGRANDVAFCHDAPEEFVRYDDRGYPFYVGEDPLDGYLRLCVSCHRTYDGSYLNFGRAS